MRYRHSVCLVLLFGAWLTFDPAVSAAQSGATAQATAEVQETERSQDETRTSPYPEPPEAPRTAIHKFGRGVAGMLTAWVEMPKQAFNAYADSRGFSKLVRPFAGLAKGAGLSLARVGIGAYEVLTFPVPLPAGYASTYEAFGLEDDPYR